MERHNLCLRLHRVLTTHTRLQIKLNRWDLLQNNVGRGMGERGPTNGSVDGVHGRSL